MRGCDDANVTAGDDDVEDNDDDDDDAAAGDVAANDDDGDADACSFAVHARMFASTILESKTLWLNSCITYVGTGEVLPLAPALVSLFTLMLTSTGGTLPSSTASSMVPPVWMTK